MTTPQTIGRALRLGVDNWRTMVRVGRAAVEVLAREQRRHQADVVASHRTANASSWGNRVTSRLILGLFLASLCATGLLVLQLELFLGTPTWLSALRFACGGLLAVVGSLLLWDLLGSRRVLRARFERRAVERHEQRLLAGSTWRWFGGIALQLIGLLWVAGGLYEMIAAWAGTNG